jgi:hypothetical protein
MAKLKAVWEGLVEGRPSGTYIRPHAAGGYEFGRWWHNPWGYRFERLGDRPTREACREGFAEADRAAEARSRALNKRRRKRHG